MLLYNIARLKSRRYLKVVCKKYGTAFVQLVTVSLIFCSICIDFSRAGIYTRKKDGGRICSTLQI